MTINRNNKGFSPLPALATGRAAQKLGLERKDTQLATAGVMLEQRARMALRLNQPELTPLKPAASLPPADPDEVWGNAGIAALQDLKSERSAG